MNKVVCKLEFPKVISDLTGNKLGRKVFDEQVLQKFNVDCENIIEIPENINDVGTSFIQGMYAKISEEYGSEKALEIMKLTCNNKETQKKINDSIETYGI